MSLPLTVEYTSEKQLPVKGTLFLELMHLITVGLLEFNVPFQHKHGYMRDERSGVESYPYPVKEGQ